MKLVFRYLLSALIATGLLCLAGVASAAQKDADLGVPAKKEADNDKQGKGEGQSAEAKKDAEAKKPTATKGGALTVHVRWSPDAKKSELKDAPGAVLYLKVQPDRQRSTDSQGVAKFNDAPIGDTTLVVLVGGPEKPCLLQVKITEAPKTIAVHVPTDCAVGTQ